MAQEAGSFSVAPLHPLAISGQPANESRASSALLSRSRDLDTRALASTIILVHELVSARTRAPIHYRRRVLVRVQGRGRTGRSNPPPLPLRLVRAHLFIHSFVCSFWSDTNTAGRRLSGPMPLLLLLSIIVVAVKRSGWAEIRASDIERLALFCGGAARSAVTHTGLSANATRCHHRLPPSTDVRRARARDSAESESQSDRERTRIVCVAGLRSQARR
jgi:hypothetical protein